MSLSAVSNMNNNSELVLTFLRLHLHTSEKSLKRYYPVVFRPRAIDGYLF